MLKKLVIGVAFFLVFPSFSFAGPMPGAIFTTLPDGGSVNKNIYDSKFDVYLDGGPGINAPIDAAGLNEGWYYFQVTDPSGKKLLSEDPTMCRNFYVNSSGVIESVAEVNIKVKGKEVGCAHLTGVDVDHNALTVQLMPYSKTPNKGGVYKAWVTPVEYFVGDETAVDNQEHFHGFVPAWSKTDNYKVKGGKPCDPSMITVRKFNDANGNGWADLGEKEIGVTELLNGGGWPVSSTDPLGVVNNNYTLWDIQASTVGDWLVNEQSVDGWIHTNTDNATVTISEECGEQHEVVFTNIQTGDVEACKNYDVLADGQPDGIMVEGFKLCLSGTAVNGVEFPEQCLLTGANGCVSWDDLWPGTYSVREVLPSGWIASGPLSQSLSLSGGDDTRSDFFNYCEGSIGMHTKGFWQNQGCSIITAADLAYLNTFAPFKSGVVETGGQDNCGSQACPESITLPFKSVEDFGCWVVANNSQDPKIGMAQQLAVFILNYRHFGGTPNDVIDISGLKFKVPQIFTAAATAWSQEQGYQFWQSTLDGFNNAGSITTISGEPCSIEY